MFAVRHLIKKDNCTQKYKALRKLYILTFGLVFISTLLNSQDLYWVGGSGTWSDPSHWSETSGGNSANAVPNVSTKVYFDDSSVSIDDVISIDESISINELTFDTEEEFTISVSSSTVHLNIITNWNFIGESDAKIELNSCLISVANMPDFLKVQFVSGGVFLINNELKTWSKKKWNAYSGDKAGHIATATVTNPLCNGGLGFIAGSVTGGVGPFVYTWFYDTNEINGDTLFNVGAGTYLLRVKDMDDGSDAFALGTIVEPPPIVTSFLNTSPSCADSATGAINAFTIFGGTPGTTNYDVEWSTGFMETSVTSSSISGLVDGPYFIIITDSSGCAVTRHDTISDPDPVFINGTVIDANCFAEASGTINTSATSGNAGVFTYAWLPDGETTPSIINKLAGIYTLHIEDVNGCPKDTTIIINEPTELVGSITSITHLICNGDCTPGEAIVTPSGGVVPYTYQWLDAGNNPIPGYTDSTASNLCAGTYSVIVSDDNTCSITISNVIINQPPVLTAVSNFTPTDCNGASTGSVVVTPSGGTLPYSYLWVDAGMTTVGTDSLIGSLPAGLYSYIVTDGTGICTITGTETITEPDTIGFDFNKLDILCNGLGSGQASVINVVGGDGNYSYLWQDAGMNTVGTTNLVTGLIAGDYTITVSDGNNCSTVMPFEIIEPTAIDLLISMDSVSCNGLMDGEATVVASGGTPGYTYLWNDPGAQTTLTAVGLLAGTYRVIVTDLNLCRDTAFIDVEEPNVISTIDAITDVICNGDSTGAIQILVSGGNGNYTYEWENDLDPGLVISVTNEIINVPAGDYTVTITDLNGCTQIENYTILEPTPITFVPTITPILCFGDPTGSITVNVSGGNGGFIYAWTDTAGTQIGNTNTLSNVAAGDYTLTATDITNCIHSETYSIIESTELFFDATVSIISCNNANDGAIDLNPSGGAPAYIFAWTSINGFVSASQNISSLLPDTYTCRITDQNGCFKDTSIVLSNPAPITITETLTHIVCNGDSTGAIDIVIGGGTPIFNFQWSNLSGYSSTDQNINNLFSGDYKVVVTDAGGCADSAVYTLIEPLPIVSIPTITDILCKGDSTGAIQIAVGGGNGGFTYIWENILDPGVTISITDEITNVVAGDYQVTITDITACSIIEVYTINEPLQGISLTLSTIDINCFSDTSGAVAVAISGGTVGSPADYIIEWYDEANTLIGNTQIVNNLIAGVYTVFVSDLNNCLAVDSIEVLQGAELFLNPSFSSVLCFGDASGSASVNPVGGTVAGDYIYEWRDPSNNVIGNTNSINGVVAGGYLITVTDDLGCIATTTIYIGQPALITTNINSIEPSCNGEMNGQLEAIVTGGTTALDYNYEWQDNLGNTIGTLAIVTGLAIGDYLIIITDDNGCMDSTNITLDEPTAITYTSTIQQISCAGIDNGEIYVSITGGITPYFVSWIDEFGNPLGNDTIISNLSPGDYTVTISDNNACPFIPLTETFTITPQSTISATYTQTVLGDCSINPPCIAEAVVVPSGGTGIYTNYQWLDSQNNDMGINNDTATGLCAGGYMVIITDSDGCSGTILALLNDQNAEDVTVETEDAICNGDLGTAIAQYVCTDAPCTLEWFDASTNSSTGLTTDTVQLLAGDYYIAITNATGCTNNVLFSISEPSLIIPNATATAVSCNGECDGTASVAPTGGVGPFTYEWDVAAGGQTTPGVIGLCAGEYFVTITDANLCDTIVSINVSTPIAISVVENITQVLCHGADDGIIDLTVSGGSGIYTYTWNPAPPIGNGTSTGSGLSPGDYTIDIADANNLSCIVSVMYTITETDSLEATFTTLESTCGNSDGEATISVIGGSPAYTYLWNDPMSQTTSTAIGLASNIYTVTVTDTNLCSTDFYVAVNDQNADTLSIDITAGNCVDNESTIVASYNCLNPVCTITWYENNATIIGTGDMITLPPGNYWVGIQNGLGCSWRIPFVVPNKSPITPNVQFTSETCNGPSDASASVNPSGGAGGYTYLWVPEPGSGQNTASVDGLYIGIWSVTIADSLGCDTTVSFEVLPFTPIDANLTYTDVECSADSNATAEVIALGGNIPLTYAWAPEPGSGQGTNMVGGLYAGDWEVVVSDLTGCDTTLFFTVSESNPIFLMDTVIVSPECDDDASGSISVSIGGGNTPYVYQWLDENQDPIPGEIDTIITDITSGTYYINVTDNIGLCDLTVGFTLESISTLQADAGPDTTYCDGYGPATLIGVGNGMGSLWMDVLGNVITFGDTLTVDPSVGNYGYIYQVTDGICTNSDTAYVVVLVAPFADAGLDQEIFIEESVEIGGDPTGPIGSIYVWMPSETLNDSTIANPVSTPLETTIYYVIVQDASGCTNIDSVLVSIKPKFNPNNGFTPNGDGKNDVWIIGDLTDFPNIEVNVFNRWGQQLFSSKGYSNPWDGTYDGKEVPVGTYYYVIDLKDEKYPDAFTGPLTIMR